jgi:hypothetical protein
MLLEKNPVGFGARSVGASSARQREHGGRRSGKPRKPEGRAEHFCAPIIARGVALVRETEAKIL